jgi:hypothetical protein
MSFVRSRLDATLFARISRLRGVRAEDRIRAELDGLRGRGFVVVHGVEQGDRGPIDHFVSGSTGLFLINARHRQYRDEHLRETWRRAEELFRELHAWVTPVICLAASSWGKPMREERVWVIRGDQIGDWISRQRNPVLEYERVARLADRFGQPSAAEPAPIS